MTNRTVTAKSSGELAKILGLSSGEAQEWDVQYALLQRLRQIVQTEGLTHAEVAKRGGFSPTRVTSILGGNLDSVSSDMLIRLLRGLGYR